MTTQTEHLPETEFTGAKDRPWELRAWSGISLSGWFRVLVRNRFAIHLICVPMALIITVLSLLNSFLGIVQAMIYGRRIARTEIEQAPIFVLGHWRSGTTLLHEMLACDPRHTYPNTYACYAPNHFLLTARFLARLLGMLLPRTRPMDNMALTWKHPQEDEWAICNMGLPSPDFTILFPNRPPQDQEYLDLRQVAPQARERWKANVLWFLKCLTVRDPKRIVLKAPPHTARVKILLEMFPDARFVHVVRNPYVIFPSTMHTWRRLYKYQGVQTPRYEGLEEYVFDSFVRMYDAFEQDRELIDPSRFCEVRYEELVSDPVGQMRRVYHGLGLEGFEQVLPAIEEYAEKASGYKTNRYQVPPQLRDQITRRWHRYVEQYGYGPPDDE